MFQAETDEARAAETAKLEEGMRVMNAFLERHGHPTSPFFLGDDDAYCLGARGRILLLLLFLFVSSLFFGPVGPALRPPN